MTDDPDDAPELLDEFFRTGEVRVDGKVVRRGRPPLGTQPKSSVTLRLDADLLDAYRALGRGWQSQINADLRRVRKLKKA
ncbi:BrnA antitoxin family protein [Rhodopseudomonas palustris]